MDTFDTLDDTQLALLLSLIAHQHCLLTTDRPALPSLITSISDFLTRSFSLEVASVSCDADTTLDEFAAGIIKDGSEGPRLANVLLLKDLDRAGEQVQAQVLELMGGKGVRLMTRKVGIAAPGRFLIVGVMERGAGRGLLPELVSTSLGGVMRGRGANEGSWITSLSAITMIASRTRIGATPRLGATTTRTRILTQRRRRSRRW